MSLFEAVFLHESSLGAARTARKARAAAKRVIASDPAGRDPEHSLHRFIERAARSAAAEVERKGGRGGSEERRARERDTAEKQKARADWYGGPLGAYDVYAKRMAQHALSQGKPVGGLWSGVPSEPGDDPWGGPFASGIRQPQLAKRVRVKAAASKERPGAGVSPDPKIRAKVAKLRLLGLIKRRRSRS